MVNRIEIAFWTALVAVLQDRRVGGRVLHTLLAVFCGLALLLALAWARFPEQPAVSASPHALAALPTRPANGQMNLLVITVDQLDAGEPRLRSVWLLGRMPPLPQVVFMPIHPAQPGENAPRVVASLPAVFIPEPGGGLPAGFGAALHARGLWWDHHIVLDDAGMAAIIDMLGGLELDGHARDGRETVALFPDAETDPEAAWNFHLQAAQQICTRSANLSRKALDEVAAIAAGRALSDQPADRLQVTLRGLVAGGGMACSFPTVSER